jgi:hypothetical protein
MPDRTSYEIPPYGTSADHLLGWLTEAVSEGEAWLAAQRPAQDWAGIREMLSASQADAPKVDGLSDTGYAKAKRIGREMVATLGNFRHEGEYKVTWDQELFQTGHLLTQLDRHWFHTTDAGDQRRMAIQNAVALGTAYLYETWDRHYHGQYRGDIRLQVFDPADVTFLQLPKDHDPQRAYAVIIREELPLNLARALYSQTNAAFAKALVPDRESQGWMGKGLQKVQQFLAPALRVAGLGRTDPAQRGGFPTVDLFHMYTLDTAINTAPTSVTMGALGTNWSYRVPALGDPLPQLHLPHNPATGQPWTIPATDADCRLFPLRRYTIFSRTGICYDGSSPWWHGHVPLARLRFGDWPWEALGSSLLAEVKTMERGIVEIMRLIEDSAAARLNPGMLYDDNVSRAWAESVNPRLAGVRASAPLAQLGDVIKPILPAEYYNVPPWIINWVQQQEERMDYQTGVRDLVAIAKAKQVPGADTLEKLLEMAGPIVQDMVQALVRPLTQLGEWRKAYYFQFYTRPRMITIAGPDGVEQDVPFLPEKLVPFHATEAPEARTERARRSIEEFRYHVTETGVSEINRMTEKLLYIQLIKALDFPISPWTLARVARVPNFGPPPAGTNTEMERWVAWKRMRMDLEADLQVAVQMRIAELTGQMPGGGGGAPAGAGGGGGVGGPAAGGATEGEPRGRAPSFSAPPRLVQKDQGMRTTITTS